jgi:glutamate dehydrogenase/leucine dehydrogenase
LSGSFEPARAERSNRVNQPPSPSAPPEELNPFRNATQQFDIAADHLDLDESTRQVLKHTRRQPVVSIPVKMAGGEVRVFEGVHAAAERYGTDMRAGAYILAVGRVAEATDVRGIFP